MVHRLLTLPKMLAFYFLLFTGLSFSDLKGNDHRLGARLSIILFIHDRFSAPGSGRLARQKVPIPEDQTF